MAAPKRLDQFHPDAVLATGHDAGAEPVLDMDDIQGHVLPGLGTAQLRLLGLSRDAAAGNAAAARRWLRQLSVRVSTARQVHEVREVRRAVARAIGRKQPVPDVFLSVALSFRILPDLQLPTAGINDPYFKGGMAAAVNTLQDPVDAHGAPIGWKLGATASTTPDLLLIIGSDDGANLEQAVEQLRQSLTGSGFRLIYDEAGAALPGAKEHFGFRDDISQPGVRGRLSARPDHVLTRRYLAPEDPRFEAFARPGQPLIWPGQFVFGYPQQAEGSSGPGALAVPHEPWMRNGSFLVLRRLRQEVAAFREFATRAAAAVSTSLGRTVTPEELQAWLVGRWPDGTPLARCPFGPDAATASDTQRVNFFSYQADEPDAVVIEEGTRRTIPGARADQLGTSCPHFAHVRKVNVRGATDLGELTRFLILRRGIPYGPEWVPGEAEDVDRGLLFMAYMQSIRQQFVTLTQTWMNSAGAPEGFGHDLLVGQSRTGRRAERTIDGINVPIESPPQERWVVPTGGGFFFTPAVSVLSQLPG